MKIILIESVKNGWIVREPGFGPYMSAIDGVAVYTDLAKLQEDLPKLLGELPPAASTGTPHYCDPGSLITDGPSRG